MLIKSGGVLVPIPASHSLTCSRLLSDRPSAFAGAPYGLKQMSVGCKLEGRRCCAAQVMVSTQAAAVIEQGRHPPAITRPA